jgi:hypothetical protein
MEQAPHVSDARVCSGLDVIVRQMRRGSTDGDGARAAARREGALRLSPCAVGLVLDGEANAEHPAAGVERGASRYSTPPPRTFRSMSGLAPELVAARGRLRAAYTVASSSSHSASRSAARAATMHTSAAKGRLEVPSRATPRA